MTTRAAVQKTQKAMPGIGGDFTSMAISVCASAVVPATDPIRCTDRLALYITGQTLVCQRKSRSYSVPQAPILGFLKLRASTIESVLRLSEPGARARIVSLPTFLLALPHTPKIAEE